jgi:hypothetical protein
MGLKIRALCHPLEGKGEASKPGDSFVAAKEDQAMQISVIYPLIGRAVSRMIHVGADQLKTHRVAMLTTGKSTASDHRDYRKYIGSMRRVVIGSVYAGLRDDFVRMKLQPHNDPSKRCPSEKGRSAMSRGQMKQKRAGRL